MKAATRALLLAVALTALLSLSGGLPGAGAAGPAAAPAAAPAAVGSAGSAGAAPWAGASFPSRFDLRDRGWVTPVRTQGDYGTCWIMAATGSLESSVLRLEGLPMDFSENNMANHMASRLDYEGMAPSEVAAAYYARWEGPVLEGSDPYPGKGESPDFLRAVRHVQQVLMLPVRAPGAADNAAVKWAVSTYGGVDASIDMDTAAKYRFWNAEKSAYFNGQRTELDHHVLCVGWDDDYPAGNFATRPPGDGAFLVKNSWGTDFGGHDAGPGYFWISYYDVSFGQALAVFSGVEGVRNFDAVYQYDALGRSAWMHPAAGGETAWFANRFRAAGSGRVSAVAFYTPVPGTTYEVRVAGSPAEVAEAPAAAAGTAAVAGYHTVRLQRPQEVTDGRSFVVAVRVTSPGWDAPVPVERPSELILPRSGPGQSYVGVDGETWTDLTDRAGDARSNVCLKAFVDDPAGRGDVRRPVVSVRGGAFRPGARITLRWRLDDPAFSSASAVVVLSVRDGDGDVVARRRIPAVAVGERGVWILQTRWPRGSYTVRGTAFDVAGRRQATAARASLVLRGASVVPAAGYGPGR